jgi:hypothetical protein
MGRKAFWKSRRVWGTLLMILGLGSESVGLVPEGTTQNLIAKITALVGAGVAVVGAVQAEQPIGFTDAR